MQPHKGTAASSSIAKGARTVDGQIDYERVFVTFTRHTEQKIAHGLIFESLLHALKERGVVLKDELYLDDSHRRKQSPYNGKAYRTTTNEKDSVFRRAEENN